MPTPVSFPYNSAKAVQVILWLLHRHRGQMDKLKLVKLVFYSDRAHLARYGRPILGGDYVAMQHGPVLSPLLNHINRAEYDNSLPFTLSGRVIGTKDTRIDYNEFSESDLEILREIDAEFGSKTPSQLWRMVHTLKAYKKHYPDPAENTSRPIPVEDLFLDLPDDSIIESIRESHEAFGLLG